MGVTSNRCPHCCFSGRGEIICIRGRVPYCGIYRNSHFTCLWGNELQHKRRHLFLLQEIMAGLISVLTIVGWLYLINGHVLITKWKRNNRAGRTDDMPSSYRNSSLWPDMKWPVVLHSHQKSMHNHWWPFCQNTSPDCHCVIIILHNCLSSQGSPLILRSLIALIDRQREVWDTRHALQRITVALAVNPIYDLISSTLTRSAPRLITKKPAGKEEEEKARK